MCCALLFHNLSHVDACDSFIKLFFEKSEGDIVIISVRPLCYLLLNHWTKFKWCNDHFFCPATWGPGEGSKGQISFDSITKSVSKIFIPNFVRVLTNKIYKTYDTGFSFCCLGHAPGVGRWGGPGVKKLEVLRRSPDLLNNVKIGQGQLQLIMEQILFLPYMGDVVILVK